MKMNNKLYRSNIDRKLLGVCGGFAEYFGIDSTIIRIAWLFFCMLGGSGLLLYFICALVMPVSPLSRESDERRHLNADEQSMNNRYQR